MKRILLFTESLGSGGAERQIAGLAVMLKQRGYHVKVLTYLERRFYEQYLVANEVPFELDTRIIHKFYGLYYLRRQIRYFKPDTVVSFLPASNKRMCIMRLLCHFNLIVSERSHTQRWSIRIKTKYLFYSFADHIVANSFSELENITSHCSWLKDKCCAIPNFIDSEVFRPNINNHKGSNAILCVGRLIPIKNILRLIDALYIIRKKGYLFNLTWIGAQYDKHYLSEVQTKILELDMDNWVVLKDQTDDVQKEYHEADVFCLPSLLEGYPNVLVEAMSCGLPVVCSNVCEMPNIVCDGLNGFLFNPLDTEDMVDAIIRMLLLPQSERKAIGFRNRNKIMENNSISLFADRYISII